MSQFQKIGGQTVDVNEPVKRGEFLKKVNALTGQVNRLMTRASEALREGRHLKDWLGDWLGRVDLRVHEIEKQLPGIENVASQNRYAISEMRREIDELKAQIAKGERE